MFSSLLLTVVLIATGRSELNLKILGDFVEEFDEIWGYANTFNDLHDRFQFMLDTNAYCQASGITDCPLMVTLCTGYNIFANPILSTYFVAGILSELAQTVYCLGEPTLKCCIKAPGNCWSAFNTPEPINCEGNPYYGPTATAGMCLKPGDCDNCLGCLCDYLAACALNRRRSLLSEEMFDSDWWKLGRMASLYSLVSQTMRYQPVLSVFNAQINEYASTYPAIYGRTWQSKQEQIIDFIEWRGCKYYIDNLNILTANIPNYDVYSWDNHLIDTADDVFADVIPNRMSLSYYAIIRYAMDIPQFWIKIDYFFNHKWTNVSRDEYLYNNSIDSAEIELLKYIDYGGLLLLQDILGDDWVIMAVPINDKTYNNFTTTPDIQQTGHLHQCQQNNGRGTAVKIFNFECIRMDNTNVINIKFNIDDTPVMSNNIVIKIFWGDSTSMDKYIVNYNDNMFDLMHEYKDNQPKYQIVIQIMNAAGLYSQYRKTIYFNDTDDMKSNVEIIGYPEIEEVELTIELKRGGPSYGNTGQQIFYFQAAPETSLVNESNYDDSDFNTLGVFEWKQTENNSVPINVTLNTYKWSLSTNMEYIGFTCRTYDHSVSSSIKAMIVNVKLKLHNGIIIDSSPYNAMLNEQLWCQRKGDIYEDDQAWSVIKLNALNVSEYNYYDGENDIEDGYYYEIVPGQYMYENHIEPTTETTPTQTITTDTTAKAARTTAVVNKEGDGSGNYNLTLSFCFIFCVFNRMNRL